MIGLNWGLTQFKAKELGAFMGLGSRWVGFVVHAKPSTNKTVGELLEFSETKKHPFYDMTGLGGLSDNSVAVTFVLLHLRVPQNQTEYIDPFSRERTQRNTGFFYAFLAFFRG